MTRAEEAALKAYPEIDYNKKPNYIHTCDSRMLDEVYREVYRNGYSRAEKDLGWISVKDRLPEEGHFVLTCVADTGTPQCVGMALLCKDNTWWDGDMKVYVDYWMEVPQFQK